MELLLGILIGFVIGVVIATSLWVAANYLVLKHVLDFSDYLETELIPLLEVDGLKLQDLIDWAEDQRGSK